MMNITWKIGVNSQAMVLAGSAPGFAGSSGGCGVGHAGRRADVVARQRDDLVAEDHQHLGRVDVRQAVLDDRIHDEQERHLEEERKAARQRADAALLEQFLLGDARLHRVTLIAALDLLDLGLQQLHPAL